jgi:TM2 domain-containing membrane protein YozV
MNTLPGADKKIPAGVCGILLGWLGVHKFILGYTTEGLIMLIVSLVVGFFSCGTASVCVGLVGLIEGVIYLTRTDAEFVDTYVTSKRPWF